MAWNGHVQALDYTKTSDLKIFHHGIKALSSKFDLQAAGSSRYSLNVSTKEFAFLTGYLLLVTIPDGTNTNQNLIDEYGQLTIEDCQAHTATYVAVPGRYSQNSVMLYQFLSNSLSDEAKNIIMVNPETYMVAGQPLGSYFLKAIIGKSTGNTIATVHVCRNSIANLEFKIKELNCDVKAFNLHVTQTRNSLIAKGEPVNKLMLNLFKGYAAVDDDAFARYIGRHQDAY
jgi:hypothetical protein